MVGFPLLWYVASFTLFPALIAAQSMSVGELMSTGIGGHLHSAKEPPQPINVSDNEKAADCGGMPLFTWRLGSVMVY